MNILLIEDHPTLADISRRVLREIYGYRVASATFGREAIQLAKALPPDLALIDLNLPDMSGYEIASELRADPRFARTVLVALTGFGYLIDEAKVRASGFDAHFRKPLDFDLLEGLYRRMQASP